MDNLNGIRKELLATDSYRMVLKDAKTYRPEYRPFNANEKADIQVEQWKAMSAEQRGFDMAFKVITGINPGDLE